MFRDIYSDHPSFCRWQHSLATDQELIDYIDAIGDVALKAGAFLDADEISNICVKATGLVDDLFDQLSSQASLGLPQAFLADLHQEAKLLIHEDLVELFAFKRQPTRIKIDDYTHLNNCQQLVNKGFVFHKLDDNWVAKLQKATHDSVQELLRNESTGPWTRENLSVNSGHSLQSAVGILNEAFSDGGILEEMGVYCGYDVCIGGLALEIGSHHSTWWQSVLTESEGKPLTLYMHRDETLRHPKAFIYLTEICKDNGAFSVVPNANAIHGKPSWIQTLIGRRIGAIGKLDRHISKGAFTHAYHQTFADPIFRELFMMLPSKLRYNSHYGWDVPSGSLIHEDLLSDEVWLEGSPGSMLIFDGSRVTHRALVSSDSSHVSLQAIFCPTQPTLSTTEKVKRKIRRIARSFLSPIRS